MRWHACGVSVWKRDAGSEQRAGSLRLPVSLSALAVAQPTLRFLKSLDVQHEDDGAAGADFDRFLQDGALAEERERLHGDVLGAGIALAADHGDHAFDLVGLDTR